MTSVHGITTGTIEHDAVVFEPPDANKPSFVAFNIFLDPHPPGSDRSQRVSVSLFGSTIRKNIGNLTAGRRVTVAGRVYPKAAQARDGRWYGELSIASGTVEFNG